MSENLIITIGREFGSGGREIARKVAEKLGIKMYDKELISMIAKSSGMSEDVLHEVDETAVNSFLYALSSGAFSGTPMVSAGVSSLPITDKAFINCSNIIKEIAEKESCVIVGRCAESVLKGRVNLLTVFVHADTEQRIDRICEHENISRDAAASVIKRADKKRAAYHNYYSDTRWGARSAYDLCINSRIGTEAAAEMIVQAARAITK
jgi:cytidylate kinase